MPFSIMAAPIYTLTNSVQILFISLHSCLLIFCRFDNSHFGKYEIIPHCGFDSIFQIMRDVEHLFKCLLAICKYSFVFSSILLLFKCSSLPFPPTPA